MEAPSTANAKEAVHVLLSSGASQQYRDDIIRVLALPRGNQLQFRYRLDDLIPGRVKDSIGSRAGSLNGKQALICFLDRANTSVPPKIVPCRFATILDASRFAGSVVLTFVVDDFPDLIDLNGFNEVLTKANSDEGGRTPSWDSAGAESLKGHFWLMRADFEQKVQRHKDHSTDLNAFEAVVDAVAALPDFATEPVFFHFLGIFEEYAQSPTEHCGRAQQLKGHGKYRLELYHYRPEVIGATPTAAQLELSTNATRLKFISPAIVNIDSRYDLKRVYFNTEYGNIAEDGALTVTRILPEPPVQTGSANAESKPVALSTPQYDGTAVDKTKTLFLIMPIRIKATWLLPVLIGVLVGALLFATQAVAVIGNDKIPMTAKWQILAAQFALSMITGIVAGLGLRKPI